MSTNSQVNQCTINNPDISGIGVRISFYLQNFCLVWLVDRSWQDAPSAMWTFITTSFGLTIAAIIQTNQKQLSFFQALQVSNLVWLANLGLFLSLAAYSRRKTARSGSNHKIRKSDHYVKYGAMLQTFFSMSLTIYLWKNASTVGNESKACFASLRYTLFVFHLPVSGAGRIVALTMSAILLSCYTLLTVLEFLFGYLSRQRRKEMRQQMTPDTKQHVPPRPPVKSHNITSPSSSAKSTVGITSINDIHSGDISLAEDRDTSKRGDTTLIPTPPKESSATHANEPEYKYRPQHRWLKCDPLFLSITILQIIIFAYFIVSTELLLAHNSGADKSTGQWSFGQILALVVVVPPIISIVEAFDEVGIGLPYPPRRSRKRTVKTGHHASRRQTIASDV